jgi:hypothetical protein
MSSKPQDIGSAALCFLPVQNLLFPDAFLVPFSAAHKRGLSALKLALRVIDQRIAIRGLDHRTPFRHLVDLFCPRGFAQALLQDDARLMAFETSGCGLRLHRARREGRH